MFISFTMLDVIDLSFDYQDEPLLHEVGFCLPAGGLLHLRGANGAGKTTLLKLIAGLHQPSQGNIQFEGQSIGHQLAAYQRQICFIGHKTGINPDLTVRENCLFDIHFGCTEKNISELASLFRLDGHIDYSCGLLSAGQRRQVGLLRLWMTDTKLWLLDEPLVALDDCSQSLLMDHIQLHRQQGGAVLLTSHQNLPLSSDEYQEYRL